MVFDGDLVRVVAARELRIENGREGRWRRLGRMNGQQPDRGVRQLPSGWIICELIALQERDAWA